MFGDASESLTKMALYRRVEQFAGGIFESCNNLQAIMEGIARIEISETS